MSKFSRLMAIMMATGFILTACGGEEGNAESSIRLPDREVTWVRKKDVRKTDSQNTTGKGKSSSTIQINNALTVKLEKDAAAGKTGVVIDEASCLARVITLDKTRMAVQKAGGMWHAFERNSESRPYSNNGMQLDSQTNRMVYALAHLCKTSKGVPMDPMEQWMDHNLKTIGEEASMQKFSDVANEGDAKTWVEHLDKARKNVDRKVDYQTIEKMINRAEPMINTYAELMAKPTGDAEMQAFISNGVTLLKSLKHFINGDKILVMAVQEDDSAPFYNLESEM